MNDSNAGADGPRVKRADNLRAGESTTRLGDWYGHILRIGRREHLLFIRSTDR